MTELSTETLLALKEFALSSGVMLDTNRIIDSVREHFEVKDREDVFHISYTSKDFDRTVEFDLKGIKKELGQTLDSTGLTMLVQYFFKIFELNNAIILIIAGELQNICANI